MTFDPQYLMFVSLGQVNGYYILNLVFSISGIYILWFVFKKLLRISLFVYFGEHSMSLYVWHMIPLRLVLDLINKVVLSRMSVHSIFYYDARYDMFNRMDYRILSW